MVALDADNTQPPELVIRMRRKQQRDSLDVVIASRYCEDGSDDKGKEVGLAFHRKILSRGASFLLDLAFHHGIEKANSEAKKSSPFIVDAFHDALVTKLYPELQKRGIVE